MDSEVFNVGIKKKKKKKREALLAALENLWKEKQFNLYFSSVHLSLSSHKALILPRPNTLSVEKLQPRTKGSESAPILDGWEGTRLITKPCKTTF